MAHIFSETTPQLEKLAELTKNASYIDPELYTQYDVKRGLRDVNGKGVLVGITDISEVTSKRVINGVETPIDGELYYRGYSVPEIVKSLPADSHCGFEECAYLLLFGNLPNKEELQEFMELLAEFRSLPPNFVRDVIMKKTSKNMMNALQRGVLTLYSYDYKPDDTSETNVLRQCLQLIANMPILSVYSYQAYSHYYNDGSLIIHNPDPNLSTAENILYCLRADQKFSPLEAKLLDVALILHMEHGGGNNSSFTTHLVSSSGTDTYSAISAALGSLKGPRHGGANLKVMEMFADLKATVKNWEDENEVERYLRALLHKEAFDRAGLIYGMGHAVYSISDPRAIAFHSYVEKLSEEKGFTKEFNLYETVAKIAPKVIAEERKIYKGVSPNVDFYSGFAYQMLGLPLELYTPIFAIARVAGWSAHRMEEICQHGKIMRPAYMTVAEHRDYVNIDNR